MSYETAKSLNDAPAPGHALLERHSQHCQRTLNGAWIAAGSETERFEIPLAVLNSPEGVAWLNPGRISSVSVYLPGGNWLMVNGAHDPIRTYGFGALGYVTLSDGRRELTHRPHPLLPNVSTAYYRVQWFSDAELATFEPLKD